MRHKSLALSLLSTLLLLALCAAAVAEDDRYGNNDDDGYEETARVARLSLIRGDVSLRRTGSDKWERAALNVPLVEGDRLATGAGARLEIQIDARNFVRVGEYATVDVVTLRDEGVALSLVEGTATLRLARFDRDREYFEIDAPGTTVAAERRGLYRLDVAQDGGVRITVRADGRARIYSQDSGFILRDGRSAELAARGGFAELDWEFADARSSDSWDSWVDERERYLASRLRYEGRDRYYDDSVWGAEELDAYGDWVSTRDYGYVWRPHSTVVNVYQNWAPYRYGHWAWLPHYGWTWVGDEPWGWAPYHYGRWVYVNGYWCWAPRGYVGYGRRSWWRPALVAFVYVPGSYGENVCWYPLSYHHRDPRSNFWRRALGADRRREESAKLRRTSPIHHRAVSSMFVRDFGSRTARAKAAEDELAQKALLGEPVLGKLPIRPAGDVDANGARERAGSNRVSGAITRGETGAGGRGELSANDAAPRRLAERATGAAARRPGVALDEELRRSRVFNNREPVFAKGAKDAGGDSSGGNTRGGSDGIGRPTGAVARPARPVITPGDGISGDGEKSGGSRRVRPGRPDEGSPTNADSDNKRPGPSRTLPVERDNGGGRDDDRRTERPERPTRPATGDSDKPSRPVFRAEPKEERRESRPEPRYERPAPREERQAPPPREERQAPPPPREERQAPPPREERPSPPPPREERQAPPPREDRPAPPPKEEKRPDPPREHSRPSRGKDGKDGNR